MAVLITCLRVIPHQIQHIKLGVKPSPGPLGFRFLPEQILRNPLPQRILHRQVGDTAAVGAAHLY